ncbi:helix-turn-helix domain-containing protein [Microbacterium sp.]|jgi:AraC-like DNA-binding protein|uniref:helix-turn-helix domain-containing protein n=1 Tax=Microbacterium sp. TaxID=51671 RepID=UPI0025F6C794|nr:helix-turn-helix domain-containing protein [Microbacterium sp.]MBT9608198.1 AraC family transcriptional regulator [Microbacterium sp.]
MSNDHSALGFLRFQDGVGWLGSIGFQRITATTTDPEVLRKILGDAGSNLLPPIRPVEMDLAALRFDSFLVARLSTRSLTMEWARMRPRSSRRFLILFVISGAVAVTTGLPRTVVENDGVLLLPPGRDRVLIDFMVPSEVVVFTFDRDEVGGLGDGTFSRDPLSMSSPVLRSACTYICGLVDNRAAEDEGNVSVLRELTRSMARALVQESSGTAEAADDEFDRILLVIKRNAHAPSFGPDQVSDALGMSRRSLERIFSAHGRTVAQTLREARVEIALRLLREEPPHSMEDVAERSGFGSVDSLRRACLRHLGRTPREIRDAGGLVEAVPSQQRAS